MPGGAGGRVRGCGLAEGELPRVVGPRYRHARLPRTRRRPPADGLHPFRLPEQLTRASRTGRWSGPPPRRPLGDVDAKPVRGVEDEHAGRGRQGRVARPLVEAGGGADAVEAEERACNGESRLTLGTHGLGRNPAGEAAGLTHLGGATWGL